MKTSWKKFFIITPNEITYTPIMKTPDEINAKIRELKRDKITLKLMIKQAETKKTRQFYKLLLGACKEQIGLLRWVLNDS